jgi:hypothetical protein
MATAVPDTFTRAALGESLGRAKPGAQRDSRRYRSRATVPGATGVLGAHGVPHRRYNLEISNSLW